MHDFLPADDQYPSEHCLQTPLLTRQYPALQTFSNRSVILDTIKT
jgi:hypothetical protein